MAAYSKDFVGQPVGKRDLNGFWPMPIRFIFGRFFRLTAARS
jgi:hypothetical protein